MHVGLGCSCHEAGREVTHYPSSIPTIRTLSLAKLEYIITLRGQREESPLTSAVVDEKYDAKLEGTICGYLELRFRSDLDGLHN